MHFFHRRKKKLFILLFFLFFSSSNFASILHNVRTSGLLRPGMFGVGIVQNYFYNNLGEHYLVRNQMLKLAISNSVQLGVQLPYINHFSKAVDNSDFGDLKLHLNVATDWFKNYILINYFVEINTGTGPVYTDTNFSPIENYGFPEFRTGFIFMKITKFITYHFNLFYVFRGQRGPDGKEPDITNGFAFNIFTKEAWKRGLGFSPEDERNFFYKGNIPNDIIEYALAVNTEIFFPWVPFVELIWNHDLGAEKSSYIREGPGTGVSRTEMTIGNKWFTKENNFSIIGAVSVPLFKMQRFYLISFSLGIHLRF